MRVFSTLEDADARFIEVASRKNNIDPAYFENHPQEDYLLVSQTLPIYVVADGVTLLQWIYENRPYPHPSPAGDVARIFCQAAVRAAEVAYDTIASPEDIRAIFAAGNEAVAEYETANGRTKETVDYWDTDFFAATAAIAVVKDGVVYWGSICDSYVAHVDANGGVLEQSPLCNALKEAEPPPYTDDAMDHKTRSTYKWHRLRNGLTPGGKRMGYGVITGEPEALAYVATGQFSLAPGERLAVLTDGFEEYMKEPEFTKLLATWPHDLSEEIADYSARMISQDPDRFGHERTLIVIGA